MLSSLFLQSSVCVAVSFFCATRIIYLLNVQLNFLIAQDKSALFLLLLEKPINFTFKQHRDTTELQDESEICSAEKDKLGGKLTVVSEIER